MSMNTREVPPIPKIAIGDVMDRPAICHELSFDLIAIRVDELVIQAFARLKR